jgi:hypothetical protein
MMGQTLKNINIFFRFYVANATDLNGEKILVLRVSGLWQSDVLLSSIPDQIRFDWKLVNGLDAYVRYFESGSETEYKKHIPGYSLRHFEVLIKIFLGSMQGCGSAFISSGSGFTI